MKYLVEVEVAASLVAEGFKLDDLKARMMVERILPLAHGSQFEARVVAIDGVEFEELDTDARDAFDDSHDTSADRE